MRKIMGIDYITDKEASLRYGYSESWFQQRRSHGNSPPFIRLNNSRILYPIEKTDKWFKDNMEVIEWINIIPIGKKKNLKI